MCAFDRLHVEVEGARVGIGADCGISGVGERAGLPVAKSGNIVLITTKGLFFRSFEFERAELLVDDLPDDFV